METNLHPSSSSAAAEDPLEVATTFDAMDAGALAVLRRPAGIGHPDHEAMAQDMIQAVKLMSEVKVIRRWPRMRPATPASRPETPHLEIPYPETPSHENVRLGGTSAKPRIVAIGASTGGPSALEDYPGVTSQRLSDTDFNRPAHGSGIYKGIRPVAGEFIWLACPCRNARRVLLPGHVYVAPDEYQMKVEREGKIALTKDDPEHGLRPSVSYLFRSVAEAYGADAIAGLLTGMGRDGASELRLLKERGAITFAQDKDSSVVHGMPGEAIKLDAAMLVLPLDENRRSANESCEP